MFWEKLSEVNEYHPMQIDECVVAIGLEQKTGFNWWVPHMLKKHDLIIALAKKHKSRCLKHTHEFGIECLKTMKDAHELDKKNDNSICPSGI